MFLQKTIAREVFVEGIGLHTGKRCGLRFRPAPSGTGIYFIRKDLPGSPAVSAQAEFVSATSMATTVSNDSFSVSTVEHCLASLSALRIDNLFIELEGPEIPIVDGSAFPFLQAIQSVGTVEQDEPRRYAYVTEPIIFEEGEKYAKVVPYNGLRLTVIIDFPHPAIGRQELDMDINEDNFEHYISKARTFGFLKDVEMLRSRGLALGGSLDNAVVLDDEKVLNPEGLRFENEFVRHKALDALGDLVTLGMPLMGHITLYKAGHDVMNKLARLILNSPDKYRRVEMGSSLPPAEALHPGSFWTHSVDQKFFRS